MKCFVPFDTEQQTTSFVLCCYWFM